MAQNLSIGSLLAIIGLPAFLVNSILIIALVKTNQLKNTTNVYILFLSLSDCIQGVVSIPLELVLFIVYADKTNCILSSTAQAFSFFNTHLSGYFILLIAFDRYLNIRPEFIEDNAVMRRLKSKCGSVLLTSVCLGMSLAHGGLSIFTDKYKRLPSLCIGIIDVIGIITIYALYIRLYLKVRCHYKESAVYTNDEHLESPRSPKYVNELAKTVLLILITVAVCYSPFIVLNIYMSSFRTSKISVTLQYIHYFLMLPVFANAALNACIIVRRNKDIRGYVLKKLLCITLSNDHPPVKRNLPTKRIKNGTFNTAFSQDTSL